MGLQHAFAMVGGLITPPLVVFKFSVNFINVDLQQYAISAALITSGICSIINIGMHCVTCVSFPYSHVIIGRCILYTFILCLFFLFASPAKFPIPGSDKIFGRMMYIGSGVLSVMGTSFTFLPVFEIGIRQMKNAGIDPEVRLVFPFLLTWFLLTLK